MSVKWKFFTCYLIVSDVCLSFRAPVAFCAFAMEIWPRVHRELKVEPRTRTKNAVVAPTLHHCCWHALNGLSFYIFPLKYASKTEVAKIDIECKTLNSQGEMSVEQVGTPAALDSKSDHIQMWNWSNWKIPVETTTSSLFPSCVANAKAVWCIWWPHTAGLH